jgi:hypothetical protein
MRMRTSMPMHMHTPHASRQRAGDRKVGAPACQERERMGRRAVEAGETRTLSMHAGTRQQQC